MPIPLDDRKQQCGMAKLTNRQLAWRAVGIKSLTKDDLTKEEQRATINLEVAIAILGGVFGWVLWVLFAALFIPNTGSWVVTLLSPMISSIVISTLIWFFTLSWVRLKKFDTIAQLHLSRWRCASCAYSLVDLVPEPDGCVVCPECNAAWKSDRVGSDPKTSQ